MVNRDVVRLLHIRDAIVAIGGYAAIGHERFLAETVTRDAILWQLELLSEATRHLSKEFRARHPQLASGSLRELQEEFDHHFLDFDLDLAWRIATETLPNLRRTVEAIIDQASQARGQASAMAIDPMLIHNRAAILRVAKENGATTVRIFGSFAKGTAGPDSDVDVLVELEPGRHLFDLIAIKHGIEDLLGREVHIVTEQAISPYVRDDIIRSAAPL